MSEGKSNSEIIAGLAEEFVERYRRGERPPVSEYTAQYPELAEEIREFFAAVAMVENLAPAESESFGDASATSAGLPELKQLGDFRIIREVGRGGMGVVYEAEQVSLGRHVALKVLPAAALPDDKHVKRFQREARSAAKLHHTNIVPVFGVGAEQDLHYYVMQFIQGLPLDEVIDELKKIRAQPSATFSGPVHARETGAAGHEAQRECSVNDMARSLMTGQFAQTMIGERDSDGDEVDAQPNLVQTATEAVPQAGDTSSARLSETLNLSGSISGSGVRLGKSGTQSSHGKPFTYWQSVANIGLQVADAMQYAHDQGILHRDIKPSNLLLDLRGTAWVTDFGLAKATDQQDITHTGDILGTLRYMPPEAFEGMADPRSDVYSLGLTLYELLCFQPAFGMKDRNQLVKQVTTEAAPRLEKLNPEIPRDLVTIVHKSIDREPSHRYQSARELQEDLQRFLNDEPIRARRISTTERLARWSRRNKGLAVSLSVVGLLLLVINIAGPVMTWRLSQLNQRLTRAERNAAAEAARNKRLADEQTALATEMTTLAELIAQRPNDPLLLGTLARHQAAAGRADAAGASLARARNLMEAMLQESPDDEMLAGFLAELLLAEAEAGQPDSWTVLKPTETESAGGAVFERQPDGSIFVSGKNPDADTYTLTAPIASDSILALRLELIPDDRLPADGSGRASNGNFRLGEFEATLISGEEDVATPLPIEDAVSDFESDLTTMWDGNPATYWMTARSQDVRHAVIFATAPMSATGVKALRVRLRFTRGNADGLNLGRFRLATTDDPAAFTTHARRFAVSGLDDPWERLGAAYAVVGDSTRATEWFNRALERAPGFAARLKLVERIDDLPMDLSDLISLRPDDPLLLRDLASRQANAGQADAAATSLARARRMTEVLLAESPADEALADFLAELLLADTTAWTTLKRIETKSDAGTTLTLQHDGSILASGENPDMESYAIVSDLGEAPISALRLELIPHHSFPNGGCGRSNSGSFTLTELSGSLLGPGDTGSELLHITRAAATSENVPEAPIAAAIDGNAGTYWSSQPRISDCIFAVFKIEGAHPQSASRLSLRLNFKSRFPHANLGRFRLSVSDDPAAFDHYQKRLAALTIKEPWLKLAAARALQGNTEAAADCCARAFDASTDLVATLDHLTRLPAGILDQVIDLNDFERLAEEQLARSVPGVRQQVWATRTFLPFSMHQLQGRKALEELISRKVSGPQRPMFLSTSPRPNSSETDFATIWTNENRNHRIELSLTRQELDHLLNTLPEDMQLVSLEEYADGESTLYAALWVAQTTQVPWELHERLSAAETATLGESMQARGFRPTYVNAWPDGTLTTVWVQDGGDSELLLGLTHHDLRNMEREQSADSLPICIDSHFDGDRRRYCLIIDNSVAGVEWKFELLERCSEFQSVFERNRDAGWKPIVTTESPVGVVADVAD